MLLRIGPDSLGIPSVDVLEILEAANVLRLPGAPPEVPGILSRRGSPATVIDLGLILGYGSSFRHRFHRFAIVRWRGHEIALAVDVVDPAPDEDDGAARFRRVELDSLLEPIF